MKIKRICAVAVAIGACVISMTGCVNFKRAKKITVYADMNLAPIVMADATQIEQRFGTQVQMRFGTTDALKQAVENGDTPDVIILGGKTTERKGSYLYGSPALRELMSKKKVDNYVSIAADNEGNVYSAGKSLSSRNYVSGQDVINYFYSTPGRSLIKRSGFTL
ncbi:MAG TPA: hypothetical protein DEP42_03985 [Ruminococcaceae bacterium]|nr:hypothetical protein [Oscillospiraceae bacterium]